MLHYKWWEIWYTTCHAALQMMRNLIYLPCGITHDEKSDIQLAMLHYKWWEIWHTICHAALHMMGNLTYCHAALHMMRNLTYNLPCCITHDGKSDIPPTEQIPTPSGRTWLRSAISYCTILILILPISLVVVVHFCLVSHANTVDTYIPGTIPYLMRHIISAIPYR